MIKRKKKRNKKLNKIINKIINKIMMIKKNWFQEQQKYKRKLKLLLKVEKNIL